MISFEIINNDNYYRFQEQIVKLYLAGFTQGENAQFIPKELAENTLQHFVEIGFGILAMKDNHAAGFLFAHPLEYDDEFPEDARLKFDNALYIAEVVVNKDFRGQGVATKLLDSVRQFAEKELYTKLILRVWDENIGALKLYKKVGFDDTGVEIYQEKYKSDQSPFMMRKIYLYKKVEK